MKTLDEILNRNDYLKLTEQLKTRVEELAVKLRNKMESLDLKKFGDYHIRTMESRPGLSVTYLAYCYGETYYNLESIAYSYYFNNDFHCYVRGATMKTALYFLNNFKVIINELDEYETRICSEIQEALSNND